MLFVKFAVKNIMRFFLSLILCTLGFCSEAQSQELQIKSFVQQNGNLSGSTLLRKDGNGDACALVVVRLMNPTARFKGNVVGSVEFLQGEYYVYMTAGSKQLSILTDDHLPLDLIFSDHKIDKLLGKRTYSLVLNTSNNIQMQTVQRSIDETIFPDWVYKQDNTWLGVSMPCSNAILAKKHALANAFLYYILNSEKTMIKNIVEFELENDDSPKTKTTNSKLKSVEHISIDKIACNIVREFYNNRGEYVVKCDFAQKKEGKCNAVIIRSVSFANGDSNDTSCDIKLNAQIDGTFIQLEAQYENGKYSIGIDGVPLFNNQQHVYENRLFIPKEGKLECALSTSFGEITSSLMYTIPWLPTSFSGKYRTTTDMAVTGGDIEFDRIHHASRIISEAPLKPIGLIWNSLSNNKLLFSTNNSSTPFTFTNSKLINNSKEIPFVITTIPIVETEGLTQYVNLYANVWKQLILHSTIFDIKENTNEEISNSNSGTPN